MLFCPKIYCPYLLSFSFFFWISFFYFHDVECMCIKRRDTYDQWIVAETCTFLILFLFVKQFATLFSMEEVQLETLANKQATLYIDSLTSIASKNVFHKISALPPKILFFLDFFTHTLLSPYICDFRDDTRYNF